MADDPQHAEPRQNVFVKFWEHAVERTEAEIAELKAAGLLREQGPVPGLTAAVQQETAAGSTVQPVVTAPAKPADTAKKEQ
jgi:hypothetical protein